MRGGYRSTYCTRLCCLPQKFQRVVKVRSRHLSLVPVLATSNARRPVQHTPLRLRRCDGLAEDLLRFLASLPFSWYLTFVPTSDAPYHRQPLSSTTHHHHNAVPKRPRKTDRLPIPPLPLATHRTTPRLCHRHDHNSVFPARTGAERVLSALDIYPGNPPPPSPLADAHQLMPPTSCSPCPSSPS